MKIVLATFLVIVSITLCGQELKKVDSVIFCSMPFIVPGNCSSDSKESFECKDYSIFWKYLDKNIIIYTNDKYLDILSKGFKNFKKRSIRCYLLGTKAKGYIVSYENEKGTDYLVIAYGIVNKQSVLVNLNSKREMTTNADLPAVVNQILRFKE